MLEQLIIIIHILAAIAVIGLILLQQGKGADMGASFGSGASQTVLGVQGGGNLLTHATAILTTVFFITSISLGYFAKQKSTVSPDHDVIVQELQKADDAGKKTEASITASNAVEVPAPAANKENKIDSQAQTAGQPAPVTAPDKNVPVKDEIPE